MKKHKRAIIVLTTFCLLVVFALYNAPTIILAFNNQLTSESKAAMKEKLNIFQINEIVFSGKNLKDFNEQIILDSFDYDNLEYYRYFNEKSRANNKIIVFKANRYVEEDTALELIVKNFNISDEHKKEFQRILKNGRYGNLDAILVVDAHKNLAVLNKDHVVDILFHPNDLEKINDTIPQVSTENGLFLRKKAEKALSNMCKSLTYDFGSECADMIVTQAYLTHDQAYELYLKNEGKDNEFSERPGLNEHRLGNSFDFKLSNKKQKTYLKSKQYEWLVNNAAEYGFIFRSDEASEDFNPYHLRFVGKRMALKLQENECSIEDYLEEEINKREVNKNEA